MKHVEDFRRLKPGTIGVLNVQEGWSLENEIQWAENYSAHLKESLHFQYDRLDAMYAQRQRWSEFLEYCNTGKYIEGSK